MISTVWLFMGATLAWYYCPPDEDTEKDSSIRPFGLYFLTLFVGILGSVFLHFAGK